MSVLRDLASELNNYAVDFMKVDFIHFVWPGGSPNVNDIGSFEVRITNSGELNAMAVTVRIAALEGLVSLATAPTGPYGAGITSVGVDVPARPHRLVPLPGGIPALREEGFELDIPVLFAGTRVVGPFYVKCLRQTSAPQPCMTGMITSYDLNLEHLLKSHGAPGAAASHEMQIFPS